MLLRYYQEETAPVKLPTRHCPQPGLRVNVRTSNIKGWYLRSQLPCRLASTLQSLPPILHIKAECSCQAIVKVHGVFPSFAAGTLHLHSEFNFTESRVETAWPSLRHSCRSELTDKEFRYLRTVIVTAAVYRGFDTRASLALTPSINLPAPGRRHTVYVHFRVCTVLCFLINSCSQLVSSTDFSSIREGLHLHISVPSPKLRHHFASSFTRVLSSAFILLPDHLCRFGVRFDVT